MSSGQEQGQGQGGGQQSERPTAADAYRAPTTSPASSRPILHQDPDCIHLSETPSAQPADPDNYQTFAWCQVCTAAISTCADCGATFQSISALGSHSKGDCESEQPLYAWLADTSVGPEDVGLSPLAERSAANSTDGRHTTGTVSTRADPHTRTHDHDADRDHAPAGEPTDD